MARPAALHNAALRRGHKSAYFQALLLHALGQHDEAFQELERAVDENSAALFVLDVDPRVDPLRSDRRFGPIRDRVARIPGAADVHIHQVVDYPEIRLEVDRNKAGQMGLTQRDVSSSLLISLSGTFQIAPAFWLNL